MKNPYWYEKSYRRSLMDMHIEDWDASFLSEYQPAAYVRLLKEAHIQSIMVYALSHVGCCYWPTKTGYMHKSLAGRDILGEVIEHRSLKILNYEFTMFDIDKFPKV